MGHVKRNYFIFLYFWGEKYNENQLKVPILAVYRNSSLVGHSSLHLDTVEQTRSTHKDITVKDITVNMMMINC